MGRLSNNIRALILVLGFASGLLGTLGSFLFIDSANDDVKALTDQRDAGRQEIDKLGGLTGDYFIANQQGDLIYALSLQPNTRSDLLALIYSGNLLDRAQPVRNIIGALATVKLLDYRKTYDEYEALNKAAQDPSDFQAYIRVKMYEQTIVQKAQARVSDLQLAQAPLEAEMSQAQARLRNRQQFMLLLSSAGAFLLLLANLVEHRRTQRAAASHE